MEVLMDCLRSTMPCESLVFYLTVSSTHCSAIPGALTLTWILPVLSPIGYAAGVTSGMLMHWYGIPFPVALLVGLAIGVFLGWINSLLIVKLKMNGMLVTFGLQLVLRAYGRILTNDNTITLGDHVKPIRQARIAALGGLQVTTRKRLPISRIWA